MNMWKRVIAIGMMLGMLPTSMPVSVYADEMIVEEDSFVISEDEVEEIIEVDSAESDEDAVIIDEDDSLILEEDATDVDDVIDENYGEEELLVASGEGVYEKLMSLKLKFPDGKYWNHIVPASEAGHNCTNEAYADSYSSTPCAVHGAQASAGQFDCNYFDGGLQCCGFAKKIFYDVFGERESSNSLIRHSGSFGISVGDYVHFAGFEHYAIVLTISGSSFTVVECNLDGYGASYNCIISWGNSYRMDQVDYYVHSNNYDTVNNTNPPQPAVSFLPWENANYTYVGSTDASIGQEINVSNGACTRTGMYLYDKDENYLAEAGQDTYYSKIFFKINEECGYTLKPGTQYKYKFYAVVNGVYHWSSMQSFVTIPLSVSFSPWENGSYTYINYTDAAIGQEINISGGTCSETGMILYDENGTFLAKASQNTYYYRIFFKINEECGYILTEGTTYKYKFYAVVDGNTYYSNLQSFVTLGKTPAPAIKPDITWTDSYSFSSKYSALLCIRANSSFSADFTEASIKIWDKNGALAASKIENGSTNTLSSLPIWYDIYSETGSMMTPDSDYTYQFSVKANGYDFDSPIYSFTTENESQNHYGIDISSHQGNIDWVTASEYVDFAIIRCGYGSDYTSNDDGQWMSNVTACEKHGIPYGVYLYSYAESVEEAESEADHVIRLLAGHNPSLPVYLDLEDNNTVGKLNNHQILEQTKAFCSKIQQAGFSAGVYASKSWWDNKLTSSEYEKYEKWIAIYSGSYAGSMKNCNMWQYSSAGRVPGINANVDLNYRSENVFLVSKCDHSTTIYKNEVSATCEKPGYSGDLYCKKCGVYLKKGFSIDPLGHDFSDNAQYCRRGCGAANPNYSMSGNPSSGTVTTLETAAKALSENGDPAGSAFSILQLKAKKVKKTSITIGWKAVPGATGYVIYAAPCGTKYVKLAEVGGTSFTQGGLKKGTYYKYFVAAHNGYGNILASSKTIHVATSGGKKGNTKAVKLNKKKAPLKKGKSVKLKATLKNGKLKVSKHRKVAFESDNPSVAIVSKSGKVKAVGPGTCYVYAYAQNGVFAKCKITVK